MMKLRLKSPILCLFWSLPLIMAVAHDAYIWQISGEGFHFSEIGYLVQHYHPPSYEKIINVLDMPLYLKTLDILFHAKTVLVTGLIAFIAVFWLNRRQRG